MRILYKLTIPLALLLAGVVLFIIFFSKDSLTAALSREEFLKTQEEVIRTVPRFLKSEYFSDYLSAESQTQFEEFLGALKRPSTVRLTIWNREGVIVFSDLAYVIGQRASQNQEVARLFESGEPFFIVHAADTAKPVQSEVGEVFQMYIPIQIENDVPGALEVRSAAAAITAPIEQELNALIFLLILGGIIMFTAVFAVGHFFISKPVNVLGEAALELGRGNLDYQISSRSKDEVGELAHGFETMRLALKESRAQEQQKRELAQKSAKELEEMVASLTKAKAAMVNLLQDERALSADLKKERDQAQAIITSLGEGLLVVDTHFTISVMNPVAEELLEVTGEKAVGKDMRTIFSLLKGEEEVGKEEEEPIAKTITSEKAITIDIEDNIFFKLSSGKKIPVTLTTAPLIGDGIIGAVVVFRDVSEKKKLEEVRSTFISTASHQLRTPLTSLRWFAEILQGGDAGPLQDEQKSLIEQMYQGIENLIRLVNFLLQISRVESGRLRVEPIPLDLKEITQGVIANLKPLIDAHSQRIEITQEPTSLPLIPLDKEIISHVIQNLLSNASLYSPQKGVIAITMRVKGDIIEYAVKDEGIGIPEKEQDRIFEKFFRAQNAIKASPDGSGLGLALVKTLAQGWGGKVWFESKEGKGSTFYFTIPREGMKPKKGEVTLSA